MTWTSKQQQQRQDRVHFVHPFIRHVTEKGKKQHVPNRINNTQAFIDFYFHAFNPAHGSLCPGAAAAVVAVVAADPDADVDDAVR